MLKTLLRLFFVLLVSSGIIFALASYRSTPAADLALGFANIQAVSVRSDGTQSMTSGIVVRLTNNKGNVQSYGISNEAGILVMPLPPGTYCYDAFTQSGKSFQMKRATAARCFTLKKDEVVTVGVEFIQ